MTPPTVSGARNVRAVLAILGVTLLWGWTFVWMKEATLASRSVLGPSGLVAGVGAFMALRFGLAAVIVALLPRVRRELDASAWRGGGVLGGLLLGGFLLQMFGLDGVSPPVSAFLTSLYVSMTALLTALRTRRGIGAWLVLGVALSTFGAAFTGGPPQLTFGLGEWLTVGCAFVFALHIVATDEVTKRVDPMAVTLTSFVVVAAGSAVVCAVGCTLEGGPGPGALRDLVLQREFVVPLVLASLLATVLALSLMNTYQRELDPVRAAILYALEPVWAAFAAWISGLSRPDLWLWIGGGALLCGNLVAELGPFLARRLLRR